MTINLINITSRVAQIITILHNNIQIMPWRVLINRKYHTDGISDKNKNIPEMSNK